MLKTENNSKRVEEINSLGVRPRAGTLKSNSILRWHTNSCHLLTIIYYALRCLIIICKSEARSGGRDSISYTRNGFLASHNTKKFSRNTESHSK